MNVRNDCRTRWVCTAAVARIIGIGARPDAWAASDSTTWEPPARTLSSASARMRSSAARRPASPAAVSNVQSTWQVAAPMVATIASNSAFDSTGLSNCSRSHWLLSSSSTLPRLPSRVRKVMTRVSRRLSIGGFVTCAKLWRK